MTFNELVGAFEAYTGVSGEIDNVDMAVWFNEAQLDLSLYFGNIKTSAPITPVSGVISTPVDNIKIIEIQSDGSNLYYRKTGGGQIYVGTDQPVNIVYRAMPAPEHVFTGTDVEQTPDLPYPIHYLLSIYAAAMYWYRESEGDTEEMNLANYWLAKYNAGKASFIKMMDRAGDDLDHWEVIE